MNKIKDKAGKLRREAEEALGADPLSSLKTHAALSPEGVQRMLHELSVHQLELEMQNEELRRVEADLEASLARYLDLYDSAPVAYCTLTNGVIGEANLTAANLLGLSKAALNGQSMTRFIHKEDLDIYDRWQERFFETDEAQGCDLRMVKADSTIFWAHLVATERRASPPRPGAGPGHATVSGRSSNKSVQPTCSSRLRSSRPSGCLPAAWPTISTTSLPRSWATPTSPA
jgi:PAS domain S-box-containing protein